LEKDIFDLHLACYRNKKKAAPWSSSEIPRTDAGILTMKSSLKHQERRTSESAWQVAEKDRRLADKDRQIHSLLNSRSWRMTAPVRALFGFSRGCRDGLLPRCFNRLERLAAPPEIKAVTFDVFDTVLLRDDKPEMRRFFEVAARQAQLLASLGIRRTTEELLHARLVCAKIAYQTAKLNRLERDASLAQMLSLMAHALELDEDLLVGRFAELELEYETENLTGDRELARRLSEIRSRGKKIFFLSDMYFAAGQIRFLLRHFLPDFSYDGGYVSSEHSLTKAGGGLFDRFCEREGFRPEEIVHIGDHYHSDFISPAGRGIRAVWLRRSPARLISRGVKNILARIDFRSLPV
jgi:FMN phosphatase YigB (HAD superfamily)